MKPSILIVDDDHDFRGDIALVLGGNFDCHEASDRSGALDLLRREQPDLCLLDLMLGDEASGLELLGEFLAVDPFLPIIMITEHASVDSAVEAMNRGAFSYVSKTTGTDELIVLLKKALQQRELQQRARRLQEEVNRNFYEIIGESPATQAMKRKIDLFAQHNQTVLIQGESGTGKELIARQIYQRSGRRNEPFVAVNCAAIPKDLLESELFGHEAGAFTGAKKRKPGKIELAGAGLIFFDEIGELDVNAQSKLLRVLEEREYERVGGVRSITTNARILTATNRDLQEMIAEGSFREDLYYRLEMLSIHAPSLRERKPDISLLIAHFLDRVCVEIKSTPKMFDSEAIRSCEEYNWPGNVRELRNAVTSAAIISGNDPVIRAEHLNERILRGRGVLKANTGTGRVPASWEEMNEMRRQAEEEAGRCIETLFLTHLMERFNGNVSSAAKSIGINRSNLYRMMKRCGIEV